MTGPDPKALDFVATTKFDPFEQYPVSSSKKATHAGTGGFLSRKSGPIAPADMTHSRYEIPRPIRVRNERQPSTNRVFYCHD